MLQQIRRIQNRKPVRIGPRDAGRMMTLPEFQSATEAAGYVYEIFDGVLSVSPFPKPWHQYWVNVVSEMMSDYMREHPDRVNAVFAGCEIVIPGRPGPTRPQPDFAAFQNYPSPPPAEWDFVCVPSSWSR